MCLIISIGDSEYIKKSREGQGFFKENENLPFTIKPQKNTFFILKLKDSDVFPLFFDFFQVL